MSSETARSSTESRLKRLLAMVPWIVAQDGPLISDVCARFSVTEKQLMVDLEDVLFICGVHPFTPGDYIDVDVSDGRVHIRMAPYFSRPLKLTPAEGLGLLGAARAVASRPDFDGDGPLGRAIAKLAASVGVDAEETLDVELGQADEAVLATIRAATAEDAVVDIDYYSFGRDRSQARAIEPHQLFSSGGAWYVWAWCRRADDRRLFRIDRIGNALGTGERFERRAMPTPPEPWSGGPKGVEVELDLPPGAAWAAEEYPVISARTDKDGRVRVRLTVTETAWLERLLLRAGPDAVVVKGDPTIGPTAAARILARYAGS